jgi:hypothetical protein
MGEQQRKEQSSNYAEEDPKYQRKINWMKRSVQPRMEWTLYLNKLSYIHFVSCMIPSPLALHLTFGMWPIGELL